MLHVKKVFLKHFLLLFLTCALSHELAAGQWGGTNLFSNWGSWTTNLNPRNAAASIYRKIQSGYSNLPANTSSDNTFSEIVSKVKKNIETDKKTSEELTQTLKNLLDASTRESWEKIDEVFQLLEKTKNLINQGAYIDTLYTSPDGKKYSALALAKINDNKEMIAFLLNKNANKNAGNPSYNDLEAQYYLKNILEDQLVDEAWLMIYNLINSGANINTLYTSPDGKRYSALALAKINDNKSMLSVLSSKNADKNAGDPSYNDLEAQYYLKNILEDQLVDEAWLMIQNLINDGANVNTLYTSPDGRNRYSALALAAIKNNTNMIEFLLKKQADPNIGTPSYAEITKSTTEKVTDFITQNLGLLQHFFRNKEN